MIRRICGLALASLLCVAAYPGAAVASGDLKNGTAPAITPCLASDAPVCFTYGGKLITVPQGAEYKLDENGALVITLTDQSPKDVGVVRIGETFVVISRDEPLQIDPRGRPRNRHRVMFTLPSLGQLSVSSINDGPDASPSRP
ncbi:MAG: hypothetical protein HYR85_15430 [Planctomycetes bacterium]|nr:hypothetical protein [Planctomycetota bacterium]MBI3846837.1 hypothetical protein [Planctomycetota bacterium]